MATSSPSSRPLEASSAPASPAAFRLQLKELLVAELNLSGRDPAGIPDEAPLFTRERAGLGLDSLDALQIAMLVEERFGVRLPEGDDARPIFASVATLADFVARAGAGGNAPQRT